MQFLYAALKGFQCVQTFIHHDSWQRLNRETGIEWLSLAHFCPRILALPMMVESPKFPWLLKGHKYTCPRCSSSRRFATVILLLLHYYANISYPKRVCMCLYIDFQWRLHFFLVIVVNGYSNRNDRELTPRFYLSRLPSSICKGKNRVESDQF